MSSFEAIALLVGWWLFNTYVIVVIMKVSVPINGIVQTGLIDGVPVAVEFRRRLLWTVSFTVHNAATILQAVGALLLIQVGMNIDDSRLQNLAYLSASIAGLAAILWPIGMASSMRYQLALLRKEEEPSDA